MRRADQRLHFVLVGHELAETRKPVDDPFVVGMEQMRAVSVHAQTVGVHLVIGVAGDVRAPVDHVDRVAGLRQRARVHRAGETGADHQDRARRRGR